MRLTAPELTDGEARKALEQMGVWERLGLGGKGEGEALQAPMASLSVGVRQRVMLARAFTGSADLVLLDEPDENLDGITRQRLQELVNRLAVSQMTALATHDTLLLQEARHVVSLAAPGANT